MGEDRGLPARPRARIRVGAGQAEGVSQTVFPQEALDASLGEGSGQQGARESCSAGSVQNRLKAGKAGGQVREEKQSHRMRGEPQSGGGARQAWMP